MIDYGTSVPLPLMDLLKRCWPASGTAALEIPVSCVDVDR